MAVFIFACFLWMQAGAQAPPLFGWQKCLGGSSLDASQRIVACANGDMLVIGNTQSTNGDILSNRGSRDFLVARLNASGIIQWTRTYGGTGSDLATSAIELANGNIVVAGYTSSNNGDVSGNHGNFDSWLICLEANGNLRWQRTLGGTNNDFTESIVLAADGGYILGGSSYSNNGNVSGNHGDQDFWIVKTDSLGVISWQRSIGGSGFEQCFSITRLADGTLAAAGVSASNNGDVSNNRGQNDCMVVRMDANGNILWAQLYGGTSMESAFHCIQNTNGNLVLAGYTNSSDSDVVMNRGSSDAWLLEINLSGTLLLSKTYGGTNSDIAYSVAQNAGGYLLASSTFSLDMDVSVNHGGEDVLMIQSDLSGNKIWTKTYGGSLSDHPANFIGDYTSGFLLCGYTNSNNGDVSGNHGSSDAWVCSLPCLAPHVAYTNTLDSMCVNTTVTFNSTSVNTSQYAWYVNGNAVSTSAGINYTFSAIGSYQVELIGNTCMMSDTYSKSLLASPVPAPVITASSTLLCNNDSILLQCSSADVYAWSTGANSSSIRVGAAGTYNVVVNTGGCSGMSLPVSISSHTIPTFSLGNDTTICSGSNFWITAPTGYQSYAWHDGSPYRSFIATLPGTFHITVSDGTCSFTDSIEIDTMNCSLLQANFNANITVICEGESIDFQDLSLNAVSWQWSFPGGTPSTSTLQHPTGIVYTTPGHHDVNLIVSNPNGSTALFRQGFITVNTVPAQPAFYATGPVLISSQGPSYQWYLNNVAIPGATSQSFTASSTGSYFVEVISSAGCTNKSAAQYITITGIGDPALTGFAVYPNPSNGTFFIRPGHSNTPVIDLEILDVTGKLVYSSRITGKQEVSLNLDFLGQGIYLLRAVNGDAINTTRIQIVR